MRTDGKNHPKIHQTAALVSQQRDGARAPEDTTVWFPLLSAGLREPWELAVLAFKELMFWG